MKTTDTSTRFLFRDADVRGNLLNLQESYLAVVDAHDYPPVIARLLGEFLAGALLLSETIKFQGRLLLQARTDGAIRLLMAEANDRREVRGIVRLDEDQPLPDDFEALFAGGTLAVMIEPEQGESYQSLVPLIGGSLAECLEHYFRQSEQLSTLIQLTASATGAGGFLLQQLPAQRVTDRRRREDQWQHLSILGASLTPAELMSLDHQTTVARLFARETVEIFEPARVRFACSCNEQRLANSLISLGSDELTVLFAESADVVLTCEFCRTEYTFDEVSLARLAAGEAPSH
ncbi:MAG: Hsp33 family molecular chaperone HslO [Pseudomonadota bacterium]